MGAILTTPGSPAVQRLVGDLRWEEDNSLWWFIAFGDKPSDAYRLTFDETHVLDGVGVCFFGGGRVVGYLSTIDAAGVADPEDYRIAWQLWLQVAPLRRDFIERCYSALQCVPKNEDTSTHGAAIAAPSAMELDESIRIYEQAIALFERTREAMQQRRRSASDSVMVHLDDSLAVNERALASLRRVLETARQEMNRRSKRRHPDWP